MIADVTDGLLIGIVNLVGLPGGWDDWRIDEERILAVQLMEAGRSAFTSPR